MGILNAHKQKTIAKKLAPIIQRYKEIDKMFDMDLEVNQVKTLSIELAGSFMDVLQLCSKYGFPKEKVKTYAQVCSELKTKINSTDEEQKLNDYSNYLLTNFNSLVKSLGIL